MVPPTPVEVPHSKKEPEQTNVQPVAPVQPVFVRREPEVKSELPPEAEVGASRSEVPAKSEAKRPDSEEKSSIRKKNLPKPEEKSSETTKKRKLKKFSGAGGRIHTEAQIDEILDFYLMTGQLPTYVSERQRWAYRHHERLPERRELLGKRGVPINEKVSSATGRPKNVVQLPRTRVQRKRSSSR